MGCVWQLVIKENDDDDDDDGNSNTQKAILLQLKSLGLAASLANRQNITDI